MYDLTGTYFGGLAEENELALVQEEYEESRPARVVTTKTVYDRSGPYTQQTILLDEFQLLVMSGGLYHLPEFLVLRACQDLSQTAEQVRGGDLNIVSEDLRNRVV